MERFLIISVFMCVLPFICNSIDQASFYGGSYILVPLKEAKATTDIHLKFRTQLPNGLLLLAAGEPDYCIVYLQAGSLKVRINLGAGESELSSPHGLILNDLLWHEVIIRRKDANISMIIDNDHIVKKHLTGDFFELNIHFGVFIGGKGDFSEIFLGLLESFRGCISELKYNGLYLLEQARKRQGLVQVQSVTWNCAAEFEMDVEKEISFVEDGAFITVSHVPVRTSLRFQMEFKTIIDQCIFLYSTGYSQKLDLLLLTLEIWKGRLKLTMKYNNNQMNVTNEVFVSDGQWHKVSIHIRNNVDLSVDQITSSSYLARLGRGRHLEFPDVFSIGGIENEKKARALAKGFKTSDVNFKGCLKNIIIDDHKIGLSNAKATEGIRPGCIWHYPCQANNPCSKHSKCLQKGLDSFQCKCDGIMCVNLNYTKEYKVFSNSSLATDLELLSVKSLQVMEGDNLLITTTNLHLVLDYHKYGIRESGIIFQVIEPPTYGTLYIDIWPRKDNTFTLLDLSRDKVRYVHDGSEVTKDRIIMDLELSSSEPFILPAYLQGKNRFTLPVIVTPINDPPILEISTSNVLRIAQGTEEFLTNKLLQVKDPDTQPQNLIYNVLPQDIKMVGHLERVGEPSVPINTFSQQEINNQRIKFIHHGGQDTNSNIALQVSDGIETSKIAFLRISTFAQHLRLQNNTGVVLVHESAIVITPYNLSIVSNVRNNLINVKYTIVTPPKFGAIEIERHDKWAEVNSFSSNELEQYRVRYRHTSGSPDYDEFKFFASLKNINSTVYSFRMTFTKLNLVNIHQKHIHLNATVEIVLTDNELLYTTEPLWTSPSLINYQIIKAPLYGYLISPSKYKMQAGNSFTQEDINSASIKYRLHRRSYSNITDSVSLTVSAMGCDYLTANITLIYRTSSELFFKIRASIKPLKVEEGGKVNITVANLNLTIDGIDYFIFNITEKPKYGTVQVIGRTKSNYFTLNELKNQQVFYTHDNSESPVDFFTFLALSDEEQNAQYTGKLFIDIILKNDNSPIRNIDKVFHVVTNGKKLLTGRDLLYTDVDIDTKPSKIVYSCREIPNGALYRLNSSSNEEIFEFTQEDLNNEVIIFKHKGESFAKIKFWVSDGQFNINGYLEVQASNPFIKVLKPKKIVVEQGKSVFITSEELQIVTNLNTKDNNIIYEIIHKPQKGKVVIISNKQEVKQFTQHDVSTSQVIYVHDDSSMSFDEMKLKIHCQEISNVVTLSFRILPTNYWKPLLLVANHTLYVEESTSIPVIKENLEVAQQQVPSKVIMYYVNEPPQYGYLDIENESNKKDSSSESIKYFSQESINQNHIRYVQSSANETQDKIIFNVTNGIVWLNKVVLNIVVVPEHLYLGTSDLEVFEGSEATFTISNLFVLTDYYKNKVTDYLIIQFPKYGCIKKDNQCIISNNFSQKELDKEVLKYSHNNSENFKDEMSVIAIAGQKRSIPATILFNIAPINDQMPSVVNNTGLHMWEGGLATITSSMLSATDDDKPKETLTYTVTGCWWGNVTFRKNPEYSIVSFTQDDVNSEEVLFKHSNGTEAKFLFTVSDGLHVTKERSFLITTKPVKLQLAKLSDLHVFPLHRSFITSNDLLSTASDPDRIIGYEVISPPNLGRLMMENEIPGNFKIVQYFTQSHINNSKVFYEHTHPFAGLYANDFFIFNIHTHLSSTIHNKKMAIDISVSSGGLDSYINVPKIEVIEGGVTNIQLNLSEVVSFLESHSGFKAPIIHLSASQPSHGYIYLTENTNTTVFTQSQIESGQIKYQHDHSDSLNDTITLSLFFIPGYITLCNVTIPIKIIPINDQPFRLVTVAPKITVVQGENYTITKTDLLTEDADTNPEDLKYLVITIPSQGKLVQIMDNGEIQDVSIVNTFTQADIDANRIVYVHSGSSLQTTFYFRVWDGKFKPEYTLFNIEVIPVIINVTSGSPVYLQQGSNVASISVNQFAIHTNAEISRVHFTVTKMPSYGVLYVKDVASNNFNYSDLLEKSVMYMQTDMSSANDSFKVFVGINSEGKNIGSIAQVVVKVQPLMQIGNLSLISGSKIKLTLSILDATPLAKLTSSNPKYSLIQKPIFGQIRKIIRSSGEKRNVVDNQVKVFTHEEIKSGLIYYLAPVVKTNFKNYEEKLLFQLSTSIFQPAIGEIRFKILPLSDKKSNLPEPRDPAGHEGGEMHMSSQSISSDYFLILTVITGVIICGITVLVIIKCRHLQCEKTGKNLQNVQLPKPPEMMSTSPYTKRYLPDNISMPTALTAQIPATVSVPQCKVTLLRPVDSLGNSEIDVRGRYPYGMSDDQTEDWSSYDTSEPTYSTHNTNLMLRKNQYWV